MLSDLVAFLFFNISTTEGKQRGEETKEGENVTYIFKSRYNYLYKEAIM